MPLLSVHFNCHYNSILVNLSTSALFIENYEIVVIWAPVFNYPKVISQTKSTRITLRLHAFAIEMPQSAS